MRFGHLVLLLATNCHCVIVHVIQTVFASSLAAHVPRPPLLLYSGYAQVSPVPLSTRRVYDHMRLVDL